MFSRDSTNFLQSFLDTLRSEAFAHPLLDHVIPGIWRLLFHCYCYFLLMNHATPFMTSYNACPDERFNVFVFVFERVCSEFLLDTSGASAIIPY
jgi:hypothetical protein